MENLRHGCQSGYRN